MRTHTQDLGDLLFGRTRSGVLSTIYGHPEAIFFVRQLAREISSSPGTVQRELTTLTTAGLLLRTKREHQVFYTANQNHPVFLELKALLAKTSGVFHLLRDALVPVRTHVEFAFVYGSFARGEETKASDIDVLVVGDLTFDDLLELVTPLEQQLKRPINPTIYASQELRAKIHSGNHFLRSIQRGSLMTLIGEEHEFREIR